MLLVGVRVWGGPCFSSMFLALLSQVADKLMEMAPEKEEVVEQRVDMVFELYKEVMQRPRIKPVFDKHHPEAHIPKKSEEAFDLSFPIP